MQLKLYTTQGCHLCELALEQIHAAQQHSDITIEEVEIGDDDSLIAQYGTTIPVISFPDGSELNWPFTEQDILNKIRG